MPKRKMSQEEAVERILRGDPFLICTKCGGLGYERETVVSGTENWARKIEICSICLLSGVVIEKTYRLACKVLKRPLPTTPRPFSGPGGSRVISELLQMNKPALTKYAEEDAIVSQHIMTGLRLHPDLPEEP